MPNGTSQTAADFLRATEVHSPTDRDLFARVHPVWETGVWLSMTGRQLVRRSDGHYRPAYGNRCSRILPSESVLHAFSIFQELARRARLTSYK